MDTLISDLRPPDPGAMSKAVQFGVLYLAAPGHSGAAQQPGPLPHGSEVCILYFVSRLRSHGCPPQLRSASLGHFPRPCRSSTCVWGSHASPSPTHTHSLHLSRLWGPGVHLTGFPGHLASPVLASQRLLGWS